MLPICGQSMIFWNMAFWSAGVSIVSCVVHYLWMTDAFRLEHDKKVSSFDCHRRFLPLNHHFRNDTKSFIKGKTVRKGPPKRKMGVDVMKFLSELKSSKMGGFVGYGEEQN
jgi:hypothetical protein